MLLPSSVDLLRCIEKTLETVIAPTLTGTGERSAAASIGHLLRHVALRIEHEGDILNEELSMLRPLLGEIAAHLKRTAAGDTEASHVVESLLNALGQPTQQGYRNVANLSVEVSALRQGVCDALEYLLPRKDRMDADGRQLFQQLEQYMAWEVKQEARMIDPAFEGFGPRR